MTGGPVAAPLPPEGKAAAVVLPAAVLGSRNTEDQPRSGWQAWAPTLLDRGRAPSAAPTAACDGRRRQTALAPRPGDRLDRGGPGRGPGSTTSVSTGGRQGSQETPFPPDGPPLAGRGPGPPVSPIPQVAAQRLSGAERPSHAPLGRATGPNRVEQLWAPTACPARSGVLGVRDQTRRAAPRWAACPLRQGWLPNRPASVTPRSPTLWAYAPFRSATSGPGGRQWTSGSVPREIPDRRDHVVRTGDHRSGTHGRPPHHHPTRRTGHAPRQRQARTGRSRTAWDEGFELALAAGRDGHRRNHHESQTVTPISARHD